MLRPSHTSTETAKKVVIVHTNYNLFSQLQRNFQQINKWRQAGADKKRNPGYAIDQLRAAVSYQLNKYVVATGMWAYSSVFRI